MKTPEIAPLSNPVAQGANGWREVITSGADYACIESFALEHLIDLQRKQATPSGAER